MRGHHPTVRAKEEDTDVGEDTPDYDYIVQVRTGHLDVTRIKNPKVNIIGEYIKPLNSFPKNTSGGNSFFRNSLFLTR